MFAAQPTYKAVISDTFTAISMKTAVARNIKLQIKIDGAWGGVVVKALRY
jgi:hypothetical protein